MQQSAAPQRLFPMQHTYLERTPTGRLGTIIETLWLHADHGWGGEEYRIRLIPDGRVELTFTMVGDRLDKGAAGAVVTGQMNGYLDIYHRCPTCKLGVRFRAVGAASVFKLPLAALMGRIVTLDDLNLDFSARVEECLPAVSDYGDKLACFERLLEELLPSTAYQKPNAVQSVVDTIEQTGGTLTIRQLCDRFGLGSRRLERLFHTEVGLSPKQFSRVTRFHRALRWIQTSPSPVLHTALDAGYFDQPHFNHDFRALTGYSPTDFLQRRATRIH